MNVFTLIVTKSPFDSRNAESAIAFCRAAFERGDQVEQVFFYQSGVHNASQLLASPSNEFACKDEWLKLASEQKIKLNVCISAASRRGVLDKTSANQNSLEEAQANLSLPFEQVGLSDYFASLAKGNINVQL